MRVQLGARGLRLRGGMFRAQAYESVVSGWRETPDETTHPSLQGVSCSIPI